MKIRRLPLPLRLYQGFTHTFEFLITKILSQRLKKDKEISERLPERKGFYEVQPPKKATLIWVHAASVGEFLAVLPLIQALCAKGILVLLTSMTKTSALLAEKRLPNGALHQFIPFDTEEYMVRFFDHWHPDLGLIVESELWPNLILTAKARNVPLFLLNARLSEKSFSRWQYTPKTIETLLQGFDLILAQSQVDQKRFSQLKAQHVLTLGNLKFDVPAPPFDENEMIFLQVQVGQRPVWLAASTHPEEEAMILETHERLLARIPNLLTVIVPRHPSRGEPLAKLATEKNLSYKIRSNAEGIDAGSSLYIADTIGELGLFFRLAHFTFMGKSFEAKGGQNPIEPIKCGSLVFYGPNVGNFQEVYDALGASKGAVQIKSSKQLEQQLFYYFYHAEESDAKRLAAQAIVQRFGGAFERTLKVLDLYIMQIGLEKK